MDKLAARQFLTTVFIHTVLAHSKTGNRSTSRKGKNQDEAKPVRRNKRLVVNLMRQYHPLSCCKKLKGKN